MTKSFKINWQYKASDKTEVGKISGLVVTNTGCSLFYLVGCKRQTDNRFFITGYNCLPEWFINGAYIRFNPHRQAVTLLKESEFRKQPLK